MMIAISANLQRRLQRAYEQQLQHYERALLLLNENPPDVEPMLADDRWARDLTDTLAAVAAIDLAMAADRREWQQSGESPDPEFRGVLHQLAERIRALAERVDRHAAGLQTWRKRMLPEVDLVIRQRQMLHAYGHFHRAADQP